MARSAKKKKAPARTAKARLKKKSPPKKKTARRAKKSAAKPAAKQKTSALIQKVIIAATPQEVYDAFADVASHAAFTGAPATGSTSVGETMTAWDGYITAKTITLVPGQRIVQEWTTSEWPDDAEPSILDLTFIPHTEGTELTMKHSNIPSSQAPSYETGWPEHYWEPMQQYFAERASGAGG